MARYIDEVELIRELAKIKDLRTLSTKTVGEAIANTPTADVVEVKHGEWIVTKTEFGWNCCEYPIEYTCSVCERTEKYEEPYCHCGAKMDGRSDT